MTREHLLTTLRAMEPELRAAGVVGLSVFGSVGRGDNGEKSDVDLAVQLGEQFSARGLEYFSSLERLERRFAERLGCAVEVLEEPVRTARLQSEIDRDRAVAF